jgi:hypothetical protein
LFAGASSSSIYRPKKEYDSDLYGGGNAESVNKMLNVDRFGITKGFQGADTAHVSEVHSIFLPNLKF